MTSIFLLLEQQTSLWVDGMPVRFKHYIRDVLGCTCHCRESRIGVLCCEPKDRRQTAPRWGCLTSPRLFQTPLTGHVHLLARECRSVVARRTSHLLPTTTTARRAAASDDDVTAAEPAPAPAASASSSPAVPEDLDYYDGLLGQQPGADKAAQGSGESASTTDYPIPLPSYLLLALATVLSIAFTGSIFEVTGGHPEVSYAKYCSCSKGGGEGGRGGGWVAVVGCRYHGPQLLRR